MPLLPTADGRLEYVETGTGSPVTVFGHGLAGSITDTRPLGSGVAGRRVFFHFRGHGASSAGGGWSYPALARDLRAVADGLGARRAVGVSMGAGALTALLAETPDRFERVVFFLPGALDRPRAGPALAHLARLADAVDAADDVRLAGLLAGELPASVRERAGARAYVDSRTAMLLGGGDGDGGLGPRGGPGGGRAAPGVGGGGAGSRARAGNAQGLRLGRGDVAREG